MSIFNNYNSRHGRMNSSSYECYLTIYLVFSISLLFSIFYCNKQTNKTLIQVKILLYYIVNTSTQNFNLQKPKLNFNIPFLKIIYKRSEEIIR